MLIQEMSCATDTGVVRKNNQDSVAVFPRLKLAILADGMGGHQAGEVASRKAIEVIRDAVSDGMELEKAVVHANDEVYQLASSNVELNGMGTTLVAIQFEELKVKIVNVGDSRMYRFRNGELTQMTVDQTVAQELREQGLDNKNGRHISTYEHVLTNALGIQGELGVAVTYDVVQPGDMHLLCSDGLSGVVDDQQIRKILARHSGPLEATVQKLLNGALLRAAPDNVSIAMVRSTLASK